MKALSQFTANRCENAKELVCHCRCMGALHGARRAQGFTNAQGDTDLKWFESLPEDDPHFVPSKKRAKELAKERKKAKKEKARWERAKLYEEQLKRDAEYYRWVRENNLENIV